MSKVYQSDNLASDVKKYNGACDIHLKNHGKGMPEPRELITDIR